MCYVCKGSQIYHTELKHNKLNTSDTGTLLRGLHLSVLNDIDSTKRNVKPDDFDFEIVNSLF